MLDAKLPTSYSNLAVGAGSQMVEAGLELARQMRPGKSTEPPKAAPFRAKPGGIGTQPWSYGSLPPEAQ